MDWLGLYRTEYIPRGVVIKGKESVWCVKHVWELAAPGVQGVEGTVTTADRTQDRDDEIDCKDKK